MSAVQANLQCVTFTYCEQWQHIRSEGAVLISSMDAATWLELTCGCLGPLGGWAA